MFKLALPLMMLVCMFSLQSQTWADERDAAVVARYQAAVAKTPADYQSWFALGVSQANQQHFDKAIAAFTQVIKLQPRLAEPHNNLAVIYNEQGNLRAAVRELEASLKLKPNYGTAQENIGDLYVKLAADAYKKALENHASVSLRQRYSYLLHIHDSEGVIELANDKQVEADGLENSTIFVREKRSSKGSKQANMADLALLSSLESWRKAWSSRDIKAYFNAYADSFHAGGTFHSLRDWQAHKKSVIGKATFINVRLQNIHIIEQHRDQARITFSQHFRSNRYSSDDQKELRFQRFPAGWKIVREIAR
ncbi:MAG: tetratricopeptide repeat protein [Mariprofundus sp.]|nr:tetratricopeptide repeat protein [Mariprofundus sp.]